MSTTMCAEPRNRTSCIAMIHIYLLMLSVLCCTVSRCHGGWVDCCVRVSTEAERGTGYCFFLLRLHYYYCWFPCVCSIAVAAVEEGYAFLFFGRDAAAANHFSCWLR